MMSNADNLPDEKLKELVVGHYKSRYPSWSNVEVTEIVEAFGGRLCVVRAKLEEGAQNEEMCFAHRDGAIRIFSSTEELAYFLERKQGLRAFLGSRVGLAAIFLPILLALAFIAGSFEGFSEQVRTLFVSAASAIVGFLFGEVSRGDKSAR